jgi:hypothetical protein
MGIIFRPHCSVKKYLSKTIKNLYAAGEFCNSPLDSRSLSRSTQVFCSHRFVNPICGIILMLQIRLEEGLWN